MERLRLLAAAFAVAALFGGCDAIFTTSPVSFLQRDPDNMSLDQRINYARDALASGDEDAIADAYDAIKDDAVASTDSELHLLAAELALALSGLESALDHLLNIDFALALAGENATYINGLVALLDGTYAGESADFYQSAAAQPDAALAGADYILGAVALLADATITFGGGDVETLGSADVNDILLFLQAGQTAVGADDPSYQLITDFADFLTANF
jgi:hypothetical protein